MVRVKHDVIDFDGSVRWIRSARRDMTQECEFIPSSLINILRPKLNHSERFPLARFVNCYGEVTQQVMSSSLASMIEETINRSKE